MKRNKDFLKIGHRKDYFDTDLYCLVTKRIDDPRTFEDWWISLKFLVDLKNQYVCLPRFKDKDTNPIYNKKNFKEQ
jgi:hypothetical protein